MSEQAGYSPSFKRPAEIMRMRRKKRARSEARVGGGDPPGEGDSSPACIRPFVPGPLLKHRGSSGSGRGIRGRNPFANLGNTQTKDPEESVTEQEGGGSPTAVPCVLDLDPGVLVAQSPEEPSRKKRLTFPESEDITASLLMTRPESSIAPAPPSEAPPTSSEYPADWSLKTRVLFTSPEALSWAEGPRAQEEATGLSQHCRAQFNTPAPTHCLMEDPKWCSRLRCSFQQSLVYWQHPSLPWLRLFPRINAERNFSGQSAPWSQDAALQQSLMREWSVSLSSLYSLLKARLCPYFYLCSYQFTVLFRAAGLAASSNITAIISPTTRGLREAMRAEGIEFSLPFVEEKKNSRQLEDEDDENWKQKADEVEDDDDDEDGSFSWLKEMGVQDKIKKVDGVLQQLQRESQAVSLDHRPESAVHVEAAHTFTLINFLLNSKSVVAAAGSQAGLPPTLLAPSAFRGATMHILKARSVNVKTQIGSSFQNISSLELTGPVLPSSLHAITSLLQSAQRGNFAATLYTHTPTAVLNMTPSNQQECVAESVDLSACGLPPSSIQQLQKPSVLGKTSLTSLKMNNHRYSWNN